MGGSSVGRGAVEEGKYLNPPALRSRRKRRLEELELLRGWARGDVSGGALAPRSTFPGGHISGGSSQTRRKRPGALTDWETALAPGKGLSDFMLVNMAWQEERPVSEVEGDTLLLARRKSCLREGGQLQRRRCDATLQLQIDVLNCSVCGRWWGGEEEGSKWDIPPLSLQVLQLTFNVTFGS